MWEGGVTGLLPASTLTNAVYRPGWPVGRVVLERDWEGVGALPPPPISPPCGFVCYRLGKLLWRLTPWHTDSWLGDAKRVIVSYDQPYSPQAHNMLPGLPKVEVTWKEDGKIPTSPISKQNNKRRPGPGGEGAQLRLDLRPRPGPAQRCCVL